MPKIVDHDQQRHALLVQCFDLFRRRGYDNVTLREIAREIGASTGTLYHYFPNKLAILEQLYEVAVRDDLGSVGGASAKGISKAEKLRRLSAMWQRSESTHAGLLLLALDLFRNSPSHSGALLAGYAKRYKAAISESLGLSAEVADGVFTYLLGANLHALLTPGDYSFPERVKSMERALGVVLEGKGKAKAGGAKGARGKAAKKKG
jgi:AcrR family transcriptional regulator